MNLSSMDGLEFSLCSCFFFSSRRRHTRYWRDWSSDVCSSDLPRRLDERGECGRLVDGELGEDTTVQLDAGQLEALHEAVVGHVVLAGRGVDPGDPQLAEVALARLAVAVGVGGRVEDLLLGLAVEPRALAAVTAGRLEGGASLLLGVDRPLHACHGKLLTCPAGRSDAQQLLHVLGVGGREDLVPVEPPLAGRGLVLELVLVVGLLAHELAGARHAHPLRGALVGLLLRHVSSSSSSSMSGPCGSTRLPHDTAVLGGAVVRAAGAPAVQALGACS